jgi:RNA polymerase sigma-70 factor (ECF subfamily)
VKDADDAEEVLQEAMMRVWRLAGSFREQGSVRGWTLRIAAHASFALLKKRRAEGVKKEARTTMQQANGNRPVETQAVERAELAQSLRAAIDGLPERDQQLVALHYVGGLSHREIAGALSLPVSVKAR